MKDKLINMSYQAKIIVVLCVLILVSFLLNIAANITNREFTCEELMSYDKYEDEFKQYADNDIIIPEECYAR